MYSTSCYYFPERQYLKINFPLTPQTLSHTHKQQYITVSNWTYNHARTSNLTTYLTYQATLGSHSGQVSLHPSPCQGPFELLAHRWSSLWNRGLPMPRLFSQHSVRCLVSHIYPVIQFKLIMLCVHAYALMVQTNYVTCACICSHGSN